MVFDYHNLTVGNRYMQFGRYVLGMSKTNTVFSNGEVSGYLPAMNIRGKNYSKVYYTKFVDYKDEFWLTEKEGIVRMHLRHPDEDSLDRVYELDSCRIIR